MSVKMVPWRERICYGFGDFASNLSYQTISAFLLFFYTDVFGIGAAAAGTIMLVARVWDAIFDPIMGSVIDKTNTKWGKCRPYLLWMAIPYGIMLILMFSSPDFNEVGKIIYATVTYLLFGMVYSAINLPLSAMLPSVSDDPKERTTLNAIRMIFARTACIIATISLPITATALGKGSKEKGFFYTVVIFACISVVLYLITFANTKERVKVSNKAVPLKDGLKALVSNRSWWIIAIASLFLFTMITIQMASATYFFKNVFNNPALMGLFIVIFFLSQILAMFVASSIAKRVGKRNTLITGMILSAVGIFIRILGGINAPAFFTGTCIAGIGAGLVGALLLSMLADAVDYGEWKAGVRAQGLLFAADSFGIKVGTGLGGAIGGWLLAAANYVPNAQQQSASAMNAISFSFNWIPFILSVLVAGVMLLHNLDKSIEGIRVDLQKRREADVLHEKNEAASI